LGGRIGDLANLPVKGSDRGRVDQNATLTSLVWLLTGHVLRGQSADVERADQIHLHHFRERGEGMRSVLADRSLGNGDAGTVDCPMQTPELTDGHSDGRADVLFAGDVHLREASARTELRGKLRSELC